MYGFIVFFSVETSLTSYSGDQAVIEGSNLSLLCIATGKPTPNIIWTRVLKNDTDGDQVFSGNPWIIVNISRTATGTYRCTAYNGIGNPVNHSLYVNVTCEYKRALHIGEITMYLCTLLTLSNNQICFFLFCAKKRGTPKGESIDFYINCYTRFALKVV